MIRVKYISLIAGILMVFACNNSNKKKENIQNNNSEIMKQSDVINSEISKVKFAHTNSNYFSASGTEPFWNLEINEERVVFKTPSDSLKVPHVEPIMAQGFNVKRYDIETESNKITIQISQTECTNAMSGKVSPYSVTIEYKKVTETEVEKLEGCGHYITDYRLHDIWVLETLNGKKITQEDFSNEFPFIEIYSAENKFMGFAGCNQMNGRLFFENGLLRFTNVATTKMLCEPNNKEAEFLKAFQSSTTYTIENNRLTLSNPSGILTIFKKID